MDGAPIVKGVYDNVHPALVLERALCALEGVFKIGKGTASTKFKEHLHQTILHGYSKGFRCSAARAILTGAIPGIPMPVAEVHSSSVKRIQQALCLLDLFETMAAEGLTKAQQPPEVTPNKKPAQKPRKRRKPAVQGRQPKIPVGCEQALREVVTAEHEIRQRYREGTL